MQMSKLQYKDGKGDPQGFTTFLKKHNIKKTILPHYRGNRLRILFHNASILIKHHTLFCNMLKTGPGIGGLKSLLPEDLQSHLGTVELQVLGMLGKTLTGPWMKHFYTSAEKEINHVAL